MGSLSFVAIYALNKQLLCKKIIKFYIYEIYKRGWRIKSTWRKKIETNSTFLVSPSLMMSAWNQDQNDDNHEEEEEINGLNHELDSLGLIYTKNSEISNEPSQLDKFQALLQSGKGSEHEWQAAIRSNEFEMVDYLLSLCNEDSEMNLASARCLAFAGNIYRRLWVDYICEGTHLEAVCNVSRFAIRHCMQSLSAIGDEESVPRVCTTYLGFDKRDIKEYNLVGYDDIVSPATEKRRRSTHGIAGMEDVDDKSASIMVWLLLLFQFFSEKSLLISARLRSHAERIESMDEEGIEPEHCLLFETFVTIAESLLRSCKAFSEDSYLQAIKVLAAINRQCPVCRSEDGTTMIAKRCGMSHFDSDAPLDGAHSPDHSSNSHSISEGLLHILNDVGYPCHVAAETIPVLQLCIDLLSYISPSNIFYKNDVKVCTDIIVRELTNVSDSDSDHSKTAEQNIVNEEVRVMYTRLAGAIISYYVRKQEDPDDIYRMSELRAVISRISEVNHSNHTWSREEAQEVLEHLDAL